LMSMSEKYSESLTKALLLEQTLQKSRKANFWLWFALIAMWTLKIVRIILGFAQPAVNKIIPLWLDIIL
jgi:hypothetical protein